jgi:hypothetical protein
MEQTGVVVVGPGQAVTLARRCIGVRPLRVTGLNRSRGRELVAATEPTS